ncbi:MAG: T9SS type A sorting domain-containing protein [Bacteroidia bacterium]|nr:T9SS type A sorting domain-containing protein [Bacteroidia bacterium]
MKLKLPMLVFICTLATQINAMQISIISESASFDLTVENNASILSVKEQIENSKSIPQDKQLLQFAEQELEDNNTLADYNINDEDAIVLIVKGDIDISKNPIHIYSDYYTRGDVNINYIGDYHIYSSSDESVSNQIQVTYPNDTVNILLDNVKITFNDGPAFMINSGGVDLTLSGYNSLVGADRYASLNNGQNPLIINAASIADTLEIPERSEQFFGAGIGGNYRQSGANIKINGGTIIANGLYGASGIGGGCFGNGYEITINGGKVIARGGEDAAGIGGTLDNNGYNIKINGGLVSAYGGNGGAGIGGGERNATNGNGYDIIITSGTVYAKGGEGAAGIGCGIFGDDCHNIIITGGSVNAEKGEASAWSPEEEFSGANIGTGILDEFTPDGPVTKNGIEVTPTNGPDNGDQPLTRYDVHEIPTLPPYYGTNDMEPDLSGLYYIYSPIPINTQNITDDGVIIYSQGKQLIIEGAEGNINVYNMLGCLMYAIKATASDANTTIDLPNTGIYIIQINNKTYKISI